VCNRAYPIQLVQISEATDDDGNVYTYEERRDYLIASPGATGSQQIQFGFSADLNENDWTVIGLSLNGDVVLTFANGEDEPTCKDE